MFEFQNIDHLPQEAWLGMSGAMLVLLQSILSGTRRVWWKLLLSCVVGAIGAAMAGNIFHGSPWVYPICGASAIMTENIILGLFNVSDQFAKNPISIIKTFWDLVVPSLNVLRGARSTAEVAALGAVAHAAQDDDAPKG